MHQTLTQKEYNKLHEILAEKRAVRELLESLKSQLARTLVKEDKWWSKVATRYELDTNNLAYTVNHAEQCIVGVPKPQRENVPLTAKPPVQPLVNNEIKQGGPTVKLIPRQHTEGGPLSREEILKMERDRQQYETENS